MKKIRVLFSPTDPYGVGHYRYIWPAQEMVNKHSEDFKVDIEIGYKPKESDIGKYDIIHLHRGFGKDTEMWVNKFKGGGAKIVIDIDDYWTPFHGHPSRNMAIENGFPKMTLDGLKLADVITTTTKLFKSIIEEAVTPPVHVIPNAIDPSMNMWADRSTNSDRVRIGWIGGSSHAMDLDKLKGTFNRLTSDRDIKDKIQIVMCGYDIRGTITEVHPITLEEHTRKLKPEESLWNKFEHIFDDYGRSGGDEYVRRNTLPITQYGKHYNSCDIILAPLVEHTFNECKSELKIIEAGMMGKALIASDVYMYKEILTHGVDAMLVNPKKDHKLWYKYIKQLVLDKEMRDSMSNNLYNKVYPWYTLEEVTKQRCKFYKEILNETNAS